MCLPSKCSLGVYFYGFSNDMGIVSKNLTYGFCLIKCNTLFGPYRMFCYCCSLVSLSVVPNVL